MPANIKASTIDGKLEMLPRAQFDVSALYYQKSLYTDDAKKAAFKAKYGYDLAPPKTFKEFSDQAIFFSNPPNFYGTQFVGKEEAITGRFYEMLVADGGEYHRPKGKPAFNSDAGVHALNWFVNLYKAKAVPAGTTNYLWDDLGQGFASGTRRARSRLAGLGGLLQRSASPRKSPATSASSCSRPARRASIRDGRERTASRSPRPARTRTPPLR